jgi:hypothetical protein
LIRTVAFPTVSDPPRAEPAFAATVNVIIALPTPEVGLALAIHVASLRTVHEQPSMAVSRTVD